MELFSQSVDELAYTTIGKRQKKFGASQIHISLDSQIADYRRRYLNVIESFSEPTTDAGFENKVIEKPRTKFETVAQRTYLQAVETRSRNVLKQYNIDTSSVFFSSVLCSCFNVQSLPLKALDYRLKDKWLIEYNIGFSVFAQKISVFTANISPETGDLDSLSLEPKDYRSFVTNEENYPIYRSLFAFLLADIGSELNIEADSINLKNCKNRIIAGAISSGVSLFTLYHELSHIILNHHAKINYLSIVDGEEAVEVANYESLEYAADSLALEIMLSELSDELIMYKKSQANSISTPMIFSPIIFFSWIDLLQRFETKIANTYRGIETHPSAASRRDRLVALYERKNLFDSNVTYADLITGSLNFMYDTVENMMSQKTLQSIKRLRSKVKKCVIR